MRAVVQPPDFASARATANSAAPRPLLPHRSPARGPRPRLRPQPPLSRTPTTSPSSTAAMPATCLNSAPGFCAPVRVATSRRRNCAESHRSRVIAARRTSSIASRSTRAGSARPGRAARGERPSPSRTFGRPGRHAHARFRDLQMVARGRLGRVRAAEPDRDDRDRDLPRPRPPAGTEQWRSGRSDGRRHGRRRRVRPAGAGSSGGSRPYDGHAAIRPKAPTPPGYTADDLDRLHPRLIRWDKVGDISGDGALTVLEPADNDDFNTGWIKLEDGMQNSLRQQQGKGRKRAGQSAASVPGRRLLAHPRAHDHRRRRLAACVQGRRHACHGRRRQSGRRSSPGARCAPLLRAAAAGHAGYGPHEDDRAGLPLPDHATDLRVGRKL